MKIVVATNNANKLLEIQALIGDSIDLLTLADIGFDDEIPEDFPTIKQNAIQKASYIHERYNLPCIADDTGLLISSLNGEPGVYSARYAGQHCSPKDNMALVLDKLEGMADRSARFVTVVAYVDQHQLRTFEGVVDGDITTEYLGNEGFGYDPIFIPAGFKYSFAQMTQKEKGKISHRGKAVRAFSEWLNARK